ncbi:hypothetical protein BH11CYA1_BH11CYA1_24200 [soil metagenome]
MQNNFSEAVRLKDIWPEFERSVPNDSAAADLIFQSLERAGRAVCRCSSSDIERIPGARKFKCRACRYETWFTANTLLSKTSNLRGWLAAIYLKQNRVVVTPSQLARLAEISPTGAAEIQKKLNFVVCADIPSDSLLVRSEFFLSAICKRSRETPARSHPVSEELTASANASFNDICSPLPLKLISVAVAFIKRYCQGVSRKYLQLYLAGFCFQVDPGQRKSDALLISCLGHPPISYQNLLDYVTAPMVQLPLLSSFS